MFLFFLISMRYNHYVTKNVIIWQCELLVAQLMGRVQIRERHGNDKIKKVVVSNFQHTIIIDLR